LWKLTLLQPETISGALQDVERRMLTFISDPNMLEGCSLNFIEAAEGGRATGG